jgi:hypothetical protein
MKKMNEWTRHDGTRTIDRLRKVLIVAAMALMLSMAAGEYAAAWGPYAQYVIASRAAGLPLDTPTGLRQQGPAVQGMPQGPGFAYASCLPKAWEYRDAAYVICAFAYPEAMWDLSATAAEASQAQAFAGFQAAEGMGDLLFFNAGAADEYERWVLELQVDSCLLDPASPWHRVVPRQWGVTGQPELIAEASTAHTSAYGGRAISAKEAANRAFGMALAMLGEKAVIDNPNFHGNAMDIPSRPSLEASLYASVKEVQDRVLDGQYLPSFVPFDPSTSVGPQGSELLEGLGELLVKTGAGTLSIDYRPDGFADYRISIGDSELADQVMLAYLKEKDLDAYAGDVLPDGP